MSKTSEVNLSLLSTKQLVGGYVPRQTADLLGLTALVQGVARTAVLEKGLNVVLIHEEDVDDALRRVAESLYITDFKKAKLKDFKRFIAAVKKTLQRKHISEEYVKKIAAEIRRIHAKKSNKAERTS